MLLSLTQLIQKYKLRITGVIHIGAHFGEEVDEYHKNGIKDIVLIEPCKAAYQKLWNRFAPHHHIKLHNCALGSVAGSAVMYTETANKGQSNSLLKPVNHLQHYPDIQFHGTEIVTVRRLDSLGLSPKYNMINMDVQGAEGQVLLGGQDTLKNIMYVYTEVNADDANLYEGATKISELDFLLKDFQRVTESWTGQGWGDALYIRMNK